MAVQKGHHIIGKRNNFMTEEFIDIVKQAKILSDNFYENKKTEMPNPYYIGFGNPSSEILILGKEKGFDYEKNKEQGFYESINNAKEWYEVVQNGISFNWNKKYGNGTYYNNCFVPYLEKIKKSGHTWNKYSKLIQKIYSAENFDDNLFLKNCFISEINHNPTKISEINRYDCKHRIDFLKHDFYKNFKITILACGNYLQKNQIEEIFDVNFKKDLSLPRNKFIIYGNGKRKLIHTRQLSFDASNSLIEKIAKNTI